MNKLEAAKVLSEQLARFIGRSHADLALLVEAQRFEVYEVRGASGGTLRR